MPISGHLEEVLNKGTIQLDSKEDLINLVKSAQKSKINPDIEIRNYSINFCNVGDDYTNTIEFRLPNGTIDADTWIQNINLFGGIIRIAQDLALIQEKPIQQLTTEDKKILACFEQIKNQELSETDKLEYLLEMVIPEKDRCIYIDRYEVNSELMEENFKIKDEISSMLSKNTIDINKIGKKVFLGDNAITGQEYNDGIQFIERDLDRANCEITLE